MERSTLVSFSVTADRPAQANTGHANADTPGIVVHLATESKSILERVG
jgi:hypothetical protein